MSGHVLVLGDDSRSALTVVRSLGRAGLRVTVGFQDSSSIVPASRYTTHAIALPGAEQDWVDAVSQLLSQDHFDLVIPTSDDALVPIVARREQFEALARCAIPDHHGFELTYRKDRTLAMAQHLGVPVPATVIIATREDWDSYCRAAGTSFPVIVKPASSKVWHDGRRLDLAVQRADDQGSLQARVLELLLLTPVLIQQFVHGVGVGQEFLAHDGEVLLAFQHERVHEPPGGGGSSYRRSVPLDAEMISLSKAMLRHMRWTGVAMVEFKRDPVTGRFALMEINGRFWGSLPLAAAAGVDFPYGLYRLLVAGERPPQEAYRLNLYGRNLSRDLEWAIQTRRTLSVGALTRELGNLLKGHERWDTFTPDDPRPWAVEARRIATSCVARVNGLVRRFCTAGVRRTPSWRAYQRVRLRRQLGRRPAVLFVCKGNICRSPFAERSLRKSLDRYGVSDIEVRSAGLYPTGGRTSPPEACVAARDFGVSLDTHHSLVITPELVENAGVVLCMESTELEVLHKQFPNAKRKLMLLGAFSPGSTVDLVDPWGSTVDGFRDNYGLIRSSVDALAAALPRRL